MPYPCTTPGSCWSPEYIVSTRMPPPVAGLCSRPCSRLGMPAVGRHAVGWSYSDRWRLTAPHATDGTTASCTSSCISVPSCISMPGWLPIAAIRAFSLRLKRAFRPAIKHFVPRKNRHHCPGCFYPSSKLAAVLMALFSRQCARWCTYSDIYACRTTVTQTQHKYSCSNCSDLGFFALPLVRGSQDGEACQTQVRDKIVE